MFTDSVTDPAGLAHALVTGNAGTLLHAYSSALRGFAAILSDRAVAALSRDSHVAYVEPDHLVSGAAGATTEPTDSNGDPWGLDRIDQRALPLDHGYTYSSTGAGVHVYLIDSGIWTAHHDFQGRADIVYDYAGGLGQDCNGHGTAGAAIVGGATYGVAKGVLLHGVRVLDCNLAAPVSQVVAGLDWVAANHKSPAVANMPIQTAPDTALSAAVRNVWNAGVFIAVTADNNNEDACLEASGHTPFAVGASTNTDERAPFSNWGTCVKIYAPGMGIKTAWPFGFPPQWFATVSPADSTAIVSGTSFAAPHVAGVAALYKAQFGDAPSDTVAQWILANATSGLPTGDPSGVTPHLLYSPVSTQPAPVASYTSTCTGLTCTFDASGSTAPSTASYAWAWGDGTPAGGGKVASHSYAAGGTYNVTLTVTDSGGANSQTQSITVAAVPRPAAAFTVSCAQLTCSFDASGSTAQPTATYGWTWGDGATGTGKTATHSYAAGGTYSVTLAVTDAGGSSSTTHAVTVVSPPVATFTSSCSGLTCSFDASGSKAQSTATYGWTWGDGTTGAGRTATHSYASWGTYSVTLTVTDGGGSSSTTQTVVANQPPIVSVGPDETVAVGIFYTLNWSFADPDNDGPWSYTVDWGDGSSSSGSAATPGAMSTMHTYVLPLSTHVTVTVTDRRGASGSASKVVTVVL